MELNLKTTVNQLNNGTIAHLYDSTLDYHVDNNPGGWCLDQNGPNPRRVDVTEIIVTIAKGDVTASVTYTDPADIAAYLNPTQGKQFSSITLYGSAYTVFEDGIYSITISMSGSWLNPDTGLAEDFDVDDEIYEAFLWALNDQIRHMVIAIDVPVKNYLEAYNTSLLNTLFNSIVYNCEYGNVENAQKIIDYLSDVLSNNTKLTELFKNLENYG